MKRFLAVFAVIAIIGSMFAQVALAQPSSDPPPSIHDVYVSLDKSVIPFSSGFAYDEISGRIFSSSTNALYQVDALVEIYKDDGDGYLDEDDTFIDSTRADDGEFEVLILTNSDDTGIGQYWAVGVDSDDEEYSHAKDFEFYHEDKDAHDSFTIMYEMELAEPEELEWYFPVSGQVVVRGVFLNEDASSEDYLTIEYTDGTFVAEANFNDDESFGFLFNGNQFVKTGDIGIYVNGVLAIEGEILPEELDVELSPEEAIRLLDETEFTATFDLDNEYLNNHEAHLCMADFYRIDLTIEDPDGKEWDSGTIVSDNSGSFDDFSNLEESFELFFGEEYEKGEYTFVFELIYDEDDEDDFVYVVAKKSIEVDVVNPSKYNLVGWDLDKHSVGDIYFTLPIDVGYDIHSEEWHYYFSPVEGYSEQKVEVLKYSRGEVEICPYVEVIVEGCGVDKTFSNFDDNGFKYDESDEEPYDGVHSVSPDETGEMVITINVYTDQEDKTPDHTFTKKVVINGWNVDISPSEVLVGYEGDVVFTIVDEDGDPVNNAIIVIDDKEVVDGTSINIIGGVYTYENDEEAVFTEVKPLTVEFWTASEWDEQTDEDEYDGDYEISKSCGIEVLGEEVYDVDSDTTVLLNGFEEAFYVTVIDENGDMVYPNYERIDVDSEGEKEASDAFELGSFKDLDGVDGKEARKITLTPNGNQVGLIIRATTDNGEKMGEVYIEVQKPEAVMTGVSTLTENIEQTVTVQLIDPRDDSELEADFYLKDNSDYYDWDTDQDWEYEDDAYSLDVLIEDVDWSEAEDDEEEVVLDLVMEGDSEVDVTVLEIPIGEATLTSNPEQVVINTATSLTLTYLDAEGNPLEGYEVTLDEEPIADTDENGQVVYSASSTSSLALDFAAETDVEDVFTELKVKSAPDMLAPTASAPEVVHGNTVVITIADNVRVHKALINGQPVDIFFPMPEVSHIASVSPGTNTFVVEAVDINNNYSKTILTVEFNNPITFTIGVPTEYGTPVLVDGTTMVPVRFAAELGASIGWDGATQTVTYTAGDVTVIVTVGSTTAIVNGENVQMTQAPYLNDQERVMVPLRMIAQELGFNVIWTSNDAPISITE